MSPLPSWWSRTLLSPRRAPRARRGRPRRRRARRTRRTRHHSKSPTPKWRPSTRHRAHYRPTARCLSDRTTGSELPGQTHPVERRRQPLFYPPQGWGHPLQEWGHPLREWGPRGSPSRAVSRSSHRVEEQRRQDRLHLRHSTFLVPLHPWSHRLRRPRSSPSRRRPSVRRRPQNRSDSGSVPRRWWLSRARWRPS